MVQALVIELSLVNFVTAFVSHNAHVTFTIFEFTAEFVAVLIFVHATIFLTVNESTNVVFLILQILE